MEDQLLRVDERDVVIGVIGKAAAHRVGTSCLHRAFSLLCFNADGTKLLLQRRASCKVTFPDVWANTCCSHPLTDETDENDHLGVRRAAERRAEQELGMHVPASAMHCVMRLCYRATYTASLEEWEMDHVLVARVDESILPSLNPDEVRETRWVTREEMDALEDVAPWFALLRTHADRWWPALAPIVHA
jgi:isopentenyl-diphosphate delta-isomerase